MTEFNKTGVVVGSVVEQYTQVKIDKNNITVGPNLFRNTYRINSTTEYQVYSKDFAGDRTVGVPAGTICTVTLCVTPAENTTHYDLYFSEGYQSVARLFVSGTHKQIVSSTYTMKYASGRTPSVNIYNGDAVLYRFPNDGTVTGTTTIYWMKIEEGTRSTGWTPAESEGFSSYVEYNPIECNEIKEI